MMEKKLLPFVIIAVIGVFAYFIYQQQQAKQAANQAALLAKLQQVQQTGTANNIGQMAGNAASDIVKLGFSIFGG